MAHRVVAYLNSCTHFALALAVVAAGFSIVGTAVAGSIEQETMVSQMITAPMAPAVLVPVSSAAPKIIAVAPAHLTTPKTGRVKGVTVTSLGVGLQGKVIADGNGFFYYLGFDNKRYVLPRPGMPDSPSSPTYDVLLSWYGNANSVVTVSQSDLLSLSLGGNATLRPGTNLLQDESDVKVYAVTPGGVLEQITSSDLLAALYGPNWQSRVAIVPDAYFTNYTVGNSISTKTYPDGTLLQYQGADGTYLIQGGQKRKFASSAAFAANNFQTSWVITNVDPTVTFPNGSDIVGAEPALFTVAGPIVSTATAPVITAPNSTQPSSQPSDESQDENQNTQGEQPGLTSPTSSPTVSGDQESYDEIAQDIQSGNTDAVLAKLQVLRNQMQELQTENTYLKKLLAGVSAPSSDTQNTLRDFITYGVDANTKALGAGERAAVLNSYKAAYGKLPETTSEFSDAIKIANGRWPSEQSPSAEASAKASFQKIYDRTPQSTNVHDNAAVTVMAYGLRQTASHRNLKSETAGIAIFKKLYGYVPSTTQEWNIMQAITYSGATR